MLVNLYSDINTESVLKAFSRRSSISMEEFYTAPFFNNVTESNYSGKKLMITIQSLLKVGYLESLEGFTPERWKITSAGWEHLHFLELPELTEREAMENARRNAVPDQNPEPQSKKQVSLRKMFRFVIAYVLPSAETGRRQNNAV